mmetsp:Transcript_22841/g.49327  ORF Transcript_22841/g.49327 Transcript_22841/m.49327 type:complete len:281 (+) Transcript_22841:152-994(+)
MHHSLSCAKIGPSDPSGNSCSSCASLDGVEPCPERATLSATAACQDSSGRADLLRRGKEPKSGTSASCAVCGGFGCWACSVHRLVFDLSNQVTTEFHAHRKLGVRSCRHGQSKGFLAPAKGQRSHSSDALPLERPWSGARSLPWREPSTDAAEGHVHLPSSPYGVECTSTASSASPTPAAPVAQAADAIEGARSATEGESIGDSESALRSKDTPKIKAAAIQDMNSVCPGSQEATSSGPRSSVAACKHTTTRLRDSLAARFTRRPPKKEVLDACVAWGVL